MHCIIFWAVLVYAIGLHRVTAGPGNSHVALTASSSGTKEDRTRDERNAKRRESYARQKEAALLDDGARASVERERITKSLYYQRNKERLSFNRRIKMNRRTEEEKSLYNLSMKQKKKERYAKDNAVYETDLFMNRLHKIKSSHTRNRILDQSIFQQIKKRIQEETAQTVREGKLPANIAETKSLQYLHKVSPGGRFGDPGVQQTQTAQVAAASDGKKDGRDYWRELLYAVDPIID